MKEDGGASADVLEGPTLESLPDDCHTNIARWIIDDLCSGSLSLLSLARTCRRFHDLCGAASFASAIASAVHRCPGARSLEALAVLETLTGLGTNRVLFDHTHDKIRAGSSMPRLVEFVGLMDRHRGLLAVVETHAGVSESDPHAQSITRALTIGHALSEICERPDVLDEHLMGRVRLRHWGSTVAAAAKWSTGSRESRHAELFFSLDAGETWLPPRPAHYASAQATLTAERGEREDYEVGEPAGSWLPPALL